MVVHLTDDSDDSRAELAAWIKREVANAPPLSPDQIEQLRGLLPYPYPADSTAA